MLLRISVFSDVICPWCYIGKRRLERALDELGLRSSTEVEWLPFELNPEMPDAGVERSVYRQQKFGADRSAALDRDMTATGLQEGIAFAFDRMTRTPNTRRAHMLVAGAQQMGRDNDLVEALFRAYFEEAQDVGDPDVLANIAAGVGVTREAADLSLRSEELRQLVTSVEQQASKMSISGVPYFIVDGSWAVSGAQPAETWVAILKERMPAAAM